MIHRILNPSSNSSFFVFGARGTGKSTWLKQQFLNKISKNYIYYDMLDDDTEERFSRNPDLLKTEIAALNKKPDWVIIDEIQKTPRLLDVVHGLIENKKIKFILTGSSARKLKKQGANLLAGRAFEYRLFPFTFIELTKSLPKKIEAFNLEDQLNFGSLPAVYRFQSRTDKIKYLKSYISTYVKIEIQMEQLLRKLDPFKQFLEVAAQMNGKPLNYSKVAKEVGVDTKTVIQYFLVLEETFMGFILPAYHTSIRKSILMTPKFYFFDVGVKRGLEKSLNSNVVPRTSYYGEVFEHYIINEFYKMNQYTESDYTLSYFATKEGAEVDLVLSLGKTKTIFVEIKSSLKVDHIEVNKLSTLIGDSKIKGYYLSQDPIAQEYNNVRCLHWAYGIKEIFDLDEDR